MSAEQLLSVRGLSIASRIDGVAKTIASDVNLELAAGETIGIVGESGSGKSLTARAILGLLPTGVHASGEVDYRGRDLLALDRKELEVLRGTELALMLQDPFTMLNPLERCIDQICLPTRGSGRASKRDRRAESLTRLAEVGIDEAAANRYPFQLSGGMRQRVCLAAALAQGPQLLIADEPSTALDVTMQAEILALLRSQQEIRQMGLILITHDLRVAFATCDRVYVLYAGSLLEVGSAGELDRAPRHPYTMELLMAEPPVDRQVHRLAVIPGSCPSPDEMEGRCVFSPRCRWAEDVCTSNQPQMAAVGTAHLCRCVRTDEIAAEMAATREQATVALPETVEAATSRNTVLRVAGLRKVFNSTARSADVVAVDQMDFTIGAGESVGLVGESGSGKTTAGRCVAGLEKPTAGTIEFDLGIDPSAPGAVQMVFQDPSSSLNPALSIRTTLREAVVAGRTGTKPTRDAIGALIERVGLPREYMDRKPGALSGGERQRIAIARAIAAGARLIICDEPVSALDVSVQAQVLNLLADVREDLGLSYLFITHDLAVARQVSDRIYVAHQGRIVEEGSPTQVLDAPQHAYTKRLIASIPGREADQAQPVAAG